MPRERDYLRLARVLAELDFRREAACAMALAS